MVLYTSMVVSTMVSVNPIPSGNAAKKAPKIGRKMVRLLTSSSSVMARKLKWRVKRLVTGFRPPPGGPIAQQKVMSTSFLKTPIALRSYHPPWSYSHPRLSENVPSGGLF